MSLRASLSILTLGFAGLVAACQNATEPEGEGPPYLAVVSKVSGAELGEQVNFTYHIHRVSAGIEWDTVITATPSDTLILSVEPATYQVRLDGLPSTCAIRQGLLQEIAIFENENTGLVRFIIVCNAALTVNLWANGELPRDSAWVWLLEGPTGSEQGLAPAIGALIFEELPPGDYKLSLYNVPEYCVFSNSGGRTQRVAVVPSGNAKLSYSIGCGREAERPRIHALRASYHDGAAVFLAEVTDPNADLRSYVFDVTDCKGAPALGTPPRQRDALNTGRTRLVDSATIIGAFELGIPDQQMAGRCALVRMVDDHGNSSAPSVVPFAEAPGARPAARAFNALLKGPTVLGVTLLVDDPAGEFFGTFAAARLADGAITGARDGQPDIGIYHPAGYVGSTVPDLTFSRFTYHDIYASILYLVDRKGRFTRLVDENVFQ